MDRRSFLMTLLGGMTAASMGGLAAAQAATPTPVPEPAHVPEVPEEQVPDTVAQGLDEAETEFSRYHYYRRRPRYYARPRYYRPRYYRRPRAYYRPRYYARPRYYRRYRRW